MTPWTSALPRAARYGQQPRADREHAMQALCATGTGTCANPACTEPDHAIRPDMDLDLCYDRTGTVLGLGHPRCAAP